MGNPVHDLTFSTQFIFGLPCALDPGVVPNDIVFHKCRLYGDMSEVLHHHIIADKQFFCQKLFHAAAWPESEIQSGLKVDVPVSMRRQRQ